MTAKKAVNACRAAGLVIALVLAGGSHTIAATVNKFETTQVLNDVPLILNGSGTRVNKVGANKVYDVALYAQSKAKTVEELIAMPGPKRLRFIALRDVPGTDFGLSFIKGMKANASPEQVQRNATSSNRMVEIFSARPKLVAGDYFSIDYVPGKGTIFYLLDVQQGAPVGESDFFEMVLKVWLGSAPVDPALKEALLGK
ncbi:MAG: chalcone isomerase family protein [Burkholderiales bacterium]|nr:chalcone isomerase family protein [Burkholderiales bacterium]